MIKKIVTLVSCFMIVISSMAGFVITAENDVFDGSDDNYSHGSELEYNYWIKDGQRAYRVGYGINQLMYSPKDISDPDMPPKTDRPWCGTLSFYRETWEWKSDVEIRTRIGVGVLGPSSGSEYSQKKVHEWLGCQEPMGWDNQMQDEPMLNLYQDRYKLLWIQNVDSKRILDVKWLYGGCVGTTFVNMKIGIFARIGYNIPRSSMPGGIVMKGGRDTRDRVFLYATGGVDEMLVVHNSTIGESFFRDRDTGQERDLNNFVGESSCGIVGGYDKISVSYIYAQRTSEWERSDDGNMGYGMIRVEFSSQF